MMSLRAFVFAIGVFAIGAPALLSLPAGAFAAEPAPAYSFKTKTVEVTVGVDDTIKADALLSANLLAEGRRWADKNRRDAEDEKRASPELFRGGNPWSFDRQYTADAVVAGRYVSICRWDYSYTGGAHPNAEVDTILWDRQLGKRISIRPFFNELADGGPTLTAVRDKILAALKAEKKERGVDDDPAMDWPKNIEPGLLKIGPVSLAPSSEAGKSSGLIFRYAPYVVGSYAEGSYDAFVPWEVLKPFVSAQGAAIFSGSLPEAAKDANAGGK